MTKPILFHDPVLFVGRAARLKIIANALQARVTELEQRTDPELNGEYIQILRDHIEELNDFIVNNLSEGSSSS